MIDIFVIALCAAITLYFGFSMDKPAHTFKEFALGSPGQFSTAILVGTMVATMMNGDSVFKGIYFGYNHGFLYTTLIVFLPATFGTLLVAYFVAPHAGKISGHLSIAESTGKFFGPAARVISAFIALFFCVGIVAFQIKCATDFLGAFLELSPEMNVMFSYGVTILMVAYTLRGGVVAVTLTDIIQLLIFVVMLPALVGYVIFHFPEASSPISRPHHVSWSLNQSMYALAYVVLGTLPDLCPAKFQRLLMSSGSRQIRDVFLISALMSLVFEAALTVIGFSLWQYKPGLGDEEGQSLLKLIFTELPNYGIKGLVISALIALVLSSADSYLNAASVLVANDIVPAWPGKKHMSDTAKLKIARISTVSLGFMGLFAALYSTSLLGIFEISFSYGIIGSIPLFMAFCGFQTKPFVAVTSMLVTIAFVTYCVFFSPFVLDNVSETIGELIVLTPTLVVLIGTLLGGHYLWGRSPIVKTDKKS